VDCRLPCVSVTQPPLLLPASPHQWNGASPLLLRAARLRRSARNPSAYGYGFLSLSSSPLLLRTDHGLTGHQLFFFLSFSSLFSLSFIHSFFLFLLSSPVLPFFPSLSYFLILRFSTISLAICYFLFF
jgi:hypothetical protein